MTESIGDQLKQTRRARKLSLAQAVQATRIRSYFLEALEADDFDSLPSPVQARGFLRIYAEYLGLEAAPLIAVLNGETPATSESDVPEAASVSTEEITPPAPREPDPEIIEEAQPIQAVEELPRSPSAPSLSQSIFNEIGQGLKQRRELLSLTLDEIERHTLVRQHYLQLIEEGAFDDLPSPVQARGMLNSYARFLDMDAEAMLLRFADALQARRVEKLPRELRRRARSETTSKFIYALRRAFSVDLVVGGGMIALMVFFGVWGANQIIAMQETPLAPQSTAPSISDVLLTPNASEAVAEIATATLASVQGSESLATATNTNAPLEITDTVEPSVTVRSNIQLVITVLQRTWIRVTVDGQVIFEGRAEGGRGYPFTGNRQIEVLTGNGAAVQITYNQLDLGPMGSADEVVDRIYSPQGIYTPTATITPLPSATLRPSVTPKPSATPRPSSTPRPTATPND